MKPAQHLLIYDKDCPFCCWYTNLFIRNGFLQKNERIPYTEAIQHPELHFNHDKARNKIALLSTENESITYGIDSLLTIIGRKLPIIQTIGNLLPFHWLLGILYNFLSYNRKIIAAIDCQGNCGCSPSTSYFWRFVFIGCGYWLFNFAVSLYFNHTNDLTINILNTFIYFISVFILQGIIFKLLGNNQLYDYLGHLSFVLIIGSFLLIINYFILSILSNYLTETSMVQAFLAGCSITALFFLHRKRIQQLHASPLLQLTFFIAIISPIPFIFNLFVL